MLWGRHRAASPSEHGQHDADPHGAQERAPRPIWLPQLAEPVSMVLRTGEKFPGRVLERSLDHLLVAVVVPVKASTQKRLRSLVLEYSNPGGRVSLSGSVTVESSSEGALVRIAEPRLLDVRQERAHVRVQVECPITLSTSPQAVPIHTHTEDLSGGGALLATPERLEEGDRVAIALTIEPGEPPITGSAEVVRVDARGRAAIELAELSTYDRWRLVHFTVVCQSREDFRRPDE
ncbi:MAG: PilZ domain-containing protein [Solirubrobacteraceae bacterium]